MNRIILIAGLVVGLFALAACSGKEKDEAAESLVVDVEDLGPDTKDMLKDLPKGLVGDKENAKYTTDNLRGEDEDDGEGG